MIIIPGYQIYDTLHESNRSIVYRGRQEYPDRPVILKLLKRTYPTPEEIARFRLEYDIAQSLDLDGVVCPYDLIPYSNSLLFSMEDFGGDSLAQYLQTQTPDVATFLSLATRITGILGQIHQHHIIHKDINPPNIIFNPATDELKLIDFGISTALHREHPSVRNPDVLEGTLAYMAPEQTGRMNRAMDYRTDYYSLGATFYEMLTGQPPFRSDDAVELVHAHIARQPSPPHQVNPKVPEAVSAVIMKLLSKTAEARYQSAHGLQVDLNASAQWRRSGRSGPFEPGRHDVSDRFQIPQKLYGRDADIGTLLAAFKRVSEGATEMMLVAGEPGIGKTALVHEVHKPILRRRGYFASGKFDQFQRNIPYSALIQAFRELIRQVLTESKEKVARWRNDLLKAFGPNGQIIIDVIPEVEVIVGKQPAIPDLGLTETQQRFDLVFRRFIGVFAQAAHPLVIFLDDLQWADKATLHFTELLLADHPYLFFIGAYRDNEVGPTHPLQITFDKLAKKGIIHHHISLGPLSLEYINQFVAETLNTTAEASRSLAELVLGKTYGNPFFVSQFLTSLYEEGLLTFDTHRRAWQWDTATIQAKGITDNVVELLTDKIQKLSQKTQRVLEWAACIGNQFDLRTVSIVMEHPPRELAADLWEAIQEGLVVPLSDAYKLLRDYPRAQGAVAAAPAIDVSEEVLVSYKFQHDRVQQAAYSLIRDDDKTKVHLKIGRLLLARFDEEKHAEMIFDITNHLNHGRLLITRQEEKDQLARLNLTAGHKAKAANAYQPALAYLSTGIALLAEDSWQQQYDLALNLHVEAAEANYLNTDFEQMERLAEEVFTHSRSLLDKVKVYELRIQAYMSQQRMFEAVETTLEILKLLGVSLPKKPTTAHILLGLLRMRWTLATKRMEDLYNLPAMTDPYKQAAMRILKDAFAPVFFSRVKLFPLLVFRMIQLSLIYGHAPSSSIGYACYGVLLCALGEIPSGYRFGRFSLRLFDKFKAETHKSQLYMTYFLSVHPWKHHFRESIESHLEGYQSGLETGNVEYVTLNMNAYTLHRFLAGVDLATVNQEFDQYRKEWKKLGHETHYASITMFRQITMNLMGKADDPYRLVGDSFDEDEQLPLLMKSNNGVAISMFYIYKAMLCYVLCAYDEALKNAKEAHAYIDSVQGSPSVPVHYFFYALALLAQPTPPSSRDWRRVVVYQKKIKKWARHAPMNYQHKYDMIEAEMARVKGRSTQAMAYYDRAIDGAREQGFIYDEAMAGEMAARFYLDLGKSKIAQVYLLDARHAYLRWGAHAKVADLDNRYAALLSLASAGNQQARPSTQNTALHETLDLATVVKASRAISGEIVLERLLKTMMHIVIENAGAQKGVLILSQKGLLVIEAESTAQEEDIVVLQSLPVEESPALSAAIVHYVARTQQHVVLNDASHEGLFTTDAYVSEHQPKSILCLPLMNQGQLTGILYLENNLTTHAFTRERLELLRILSAEIAISIENARLYNNLEQKVADRTAALRKQNTELETAYRHLKTTQAQLIQAEKMASLGQLTAGIAHEIKNPLNFVNNFSEIVVELSDELKDLLSPHLDASLQGEADDFRMILSDLAQNAQVIVQHGKRADGIVRAMMQHASAGTGQREPTNLNKLVSEHIDLAYHGKRAQVSDFTVEIRRELDEDVGVIEIVPQEIGRVLLNLLSNAFDAVHEQARAVNGDYAPTVTVSTRRVDAQVEIRVSDNGPGIDKNLRQKIFEPFFTTKPTGSGTGLGLSLSYDIVTQGHGGTLTVESVEGQGATFVIALPPA